MSITVVGSVAYDAIKTPYASTKKTEGGSATYFSIAASNFTKVNLVGVVGKDFSDKFLERLNKRGIDTSGVEKIKDGKTFFWKGYYTCDMNQANTIDTKLNVFEKFSPKIPEKYKKSKILFLANIDPQLQLDVIKAFSKQKIIIACDTMNFWISSKPKKVLQVIKKCNIVFINDAEIRQLTKENNLVKAGKILLKTGPDYIVIKKGEHGVLLVGKKILIAYPAIPLETVIDPTGAGDSYAGGFLGYLASKKTISKKTLLEAVKAATIVASNTVQGLGTEELFKLDRKKIKI